jgi:hypothetical protein
MEKFTEGLERVVGTVMPVAQQVLSASKKPQQIPQQMAPPRPIVVDLGPRRAVLPSPQSQPIQNPEQPQAQQAQQAQTEEKVVNDLTEFALPSAEDDMIKAGTKLIKNVDLAVQRNLTPEQIVSQILEPFETSAAMVMSMISGMDVDQLLEFIEGNVPSDWAILSPRGEELVTAAFELWQGSEEQGAAQ